MLRKTANTIILHRETGTTTLEPGKIFDFSQAEISELSRINPNALVKLTEEEVERYTERAGQAAAAEDAAAEAAAAEAAAAEDAAAEAAAAEAAAAEAAAAEAAAAAGKGKGKNGKPADDDGL